MGRASRFAGSPDVSPPVLPSCLPEDARVLDDIAQLVQQLEQSLANQDWEGRAALGPWDDKAALAVGFALLEIHRALAACACLAPADIPASQERLRRALQHPWARWVWQAQLQALTVADVQQANPALPASALAPACRRLQVWLGLGVGERSEETDPVGEADRPE